MSRHLHFSSAAVRTPAPLPTTTIRSSFSYWHAPASVTNVIRTTQPGPALTTPVFRLGRIVGILRFGKQDAGFELANGKGTWELCVVDNGYRITKGGMVEGEVVRVPGQEHRFTISWHGEEEVTHVVDGKKIGRWPKRQQKVIVYHGRGVNDVACEVDVASRTNGEVVLKSGSRGLERKAECSCLFLWLAISMWRKDSKGLCQGMSRSTKSTLSLMSSTVDR